MSTAVSSIVISCRNTSARHNRHYRQRNPRHHRYAALPTPTECRHAHVAIQTFLNWCVPRYLSHKSHGRPQARPRNLINVNRVLSYKELRSVWKAAQALLTSAPSSNSAFLLGQRRGEISLMDRPGFVATCSSSRPPSLKIAENTPFPLTPRASPSERLSRSAIGGVINNATRYSSLASPTGSSMICAAPSQPTSQNSHCAACHRTHPQPRQLLNLSPLAGVYNRASYLKEMREALELYEKHLLKIFNSE